MKKVDLNLLIALDVLLRECSVASAARILNLSPSAMSRTLSRLRQTTGDPLLVRAGRGLVPTPRALELKESVSQVVSEAEAILTPSQSLDLSRLERTFKIHASDSFIENFGPSLTNRIREAAPNVTLYFIPRSDNRHSMLREGGVDLEIGVVISCTPPELRTQALFRDSFIGVIRKEHPLANQKITPEMYAECSHVEVPQHVPTKNGNLGPIDRHLKPLGLERNIVMIVGGFATVISVARKTGLFATVPDRQTANLRKDLQSVELPIKTVPITVSLMWHPRMEADPGHKWVRNQLRDVCRHELDTNLPPVLSTVAV